jgi:hypothetical protein
MRAPTVRSAEGSKATTRSWTLLAAVCISLSMAVVVNLLSRYSSCAAHSEHLVRQQFVSAVSSEEMLHQAYQMMREAKIELNTTQSHWFDHLRISKFMASRRSKRCAEDMFIHCIHVLVMSMMHLS